MDWQPLMRWFAHLGFLDKRMQLKVLWALMLAEQSLVAQPTAGDGDGPLVHLNPRCCCGVWHGRPCLPEMAMDL